MARNRHDCPVRRSPVLGVQRRKSFWALRSSFDPSRTRNPPCRLAQWNRSDVIFRSFWGADMRRRDFMTLVGGTALAGPLMAGAQQQKQVFRIGFLGTDGGAADAIFVNSLRTHGLVEGQNLSIERRFTIETQLIPGMVADVIRQNVDVIVANFHPLGIAAKKATGTIPIVVLGSHGGVDVGLYASLAHPGGNVTGIDTLAESLDAKRIDILSS